MTTLRITAKGQITLRKAVLEALGAKPGDKVEVVPAPGGGVTLRPANKSGSLASVYCRFADRVAEPVSIEEMNEVIAAGWAGEL